MLGQNPDGSYYTTVSASDNVSLVTTSICSTSFFTVDSTNPIDNGANLTFTNDYDVDGNDIDVSWVAFSDANLSDHKLKTFTNDTCSVGEIDHGWTGSASNSNNILIDGLNVGTIYHGIVIAKDLANKETQSSCSTDSILIGDANLDEVLGSHDFGTVSTNVSQIFTIKNLGEVASGSITVTFNTLEDPLSYEKVTDNCDGTVLGSLDTCTIVIQFNGATIPAGTYNATLDVVSTPGGSTLTTMQGTK